MKPQAPSERPAGAPAPVLAIHLLGAPSVVLNGRAQPLPRGHKVWGLLACLVRSGAPVSRQRLAGLLFEEAEDPLAALRWNLSELRRLLGGVCSLRGDMLALEPGDGIYVDVTAVTAGHWSDALGAPGLGQELLAGMGFAGSPAFEVWLATERRHLQATTEAVLREAALARLTGGAASAAADLAARLVQLNPLDENYQVLLVRSLAASGNGVGAARQAAACRELFRRELGTTPSPALETALHTVTAAPTAQPATGRAAVIAQLDAGEAAIGAGALHAGLQCLRRSIAEADVLGDPVLRTRARVALGGALVHAARGRDEEGATALHEALAVGKAAAPWLAAAACRELGYVEFLRGRYDRALLWLREALPLAGEDLAEQARIATVHGMVLSDTAHYEPAVVLLRRAIALAEEQGETRQMSMALSMLGRAQLLCGELDAGAASLDRAIAQSQHSWTAFLPWPQSLRAEIDLLRGNLSAASARFEHAFALGCQFGDPCWEGIAGRGLGRVAAVQGNTARAVGLLLDAINRCVRVPDAYLWGKGYALDALCSVAVAQALPQANEWTQELQELAARSGMRELTARACLHRAALGDAPSAAAARMLVPEIGNPVLLAMLKIETQSSGPRGQALPDTYKTPRASADRTP